MTTTSRRLTSTQSDVFDALAKFGANGADIDELAEAMGLAKSSLYRHIQYLHANNHITKLKARRQGKVLYSASSKTSMPNMPAMGAIIPAIPIANYLMQWKTIENIDDWKHLQAMRQFPYLLSEMGRFADRWTSNDPNVRPTKEEVETVRKAILNIAQRAMHVSSMAQAVLNDGRYWDKGTAHKMWFQDDSIPFSPAALIEAWQHLKEITK